MVLLYGIFLIAMAIQGYLKGSVVSLISGGAAGMLEIGLAAYTRTNPRIGRMGSALIALLIFGRFAPAYFTGHKLTSLALAVVSIVVFLCLLGGHFYAVSRRKATEPPAESAKA